QCLFFSPAPRDPRPSTFPYTTLFRSVPLHGAGHYPSRLTACYETMTTTVTQMTRRHVSAIVIAVVAVGGATLVTAAPSGLARPRSEEHTSELQSRENLVCRLLLEKKK